MNEALNQAQMIVITGPVGSGKSTTAAMVHELLSSGEVPNALIDMDYLRAAWPEQGPFNTRIGYRNLRSIVANYRETGVNCFVLADVVETQVQRAEYIRAAPDATIMIVRLRVPRDVIEARLRRRQSPETRAWYLNRAPELEAILTSRDIGDIVIDVGHRNATEVARDIVDRLGLGTREDFAPL
jgi:adenylylsulfate kinase-like enzyme